MGTTGKLTLLGAMAVGAFSGAAVGATNAALTGQNIGEGALEGAISGAITGGILHGLGPSGDLLKTGVMSSYREILHVAGHGILGGVRNEVMGGRFMDGFLSGAAVAAAGYIPGLDGIMKAAGNGDPVGMFYRSMIAGAIGGTAAAIGGGKFANGAYTAAFQHLLNAEVMTRRQELAERAELGKKVFKLKESLQAEKARRPGQALTITSDEIMIVMRHFFLTASEQISKMSAMEGDYFTFLRKHADTMFHTEFNDDSFMLINLGNSSFPASGPHYSGSDINHLAVGIAWAIRGHVISAQLAPASAVANNGISALKELPNIHGHEFTTAGLANGDYLALGQSGV